MEVTSSPVTVACRFASKSDDAGVLCHCMGVMEASVREMVIAGEVASLDEVKEKTGACTGCQACSCRVNRVLDGLPAACGGRFDLCGGCGYISAICQCAAA